MDAKRLILLLGIGMMIGLTLVFLRTEHRKTVYRLTRLSAREQQLNKALASQDARLYESLSNPSMIAERIRQYELELVAPGHTPPPRPTIARHMARPR